MGRSFSGMQYCATLKPLLLLRSPGLAAGPGHTNAMAATKTAILILIDMLLLPKFERSVFADWIANRVALFPSLWRVITSTVVHGNVAGQPVDIVFHPHGIVMYPSHRSDYSQPIGEFAIAAASEHTRDEIVPGINRADP